MRAKALVRPLAVQQRGNKRWQMWPWTWSELAHANITHKKRSPDTSGREAEEQKTDGKVSLGMDLNRQSCAHTRRVMYNEQHTNMFWQCTALNTRQHQHGILRTHTCISIRRVSQFCSPYFTFFTKLQPTLPSALCKLLDLRTWLEGKKMATWHFHFQKQSHFWHLHTVGRSEAYEHCLGKGSYTS